MTDTTGSDADPGSRSAAPDEDLGGDPACWLNMVCPECGLFVEDRTARACPRCGSVLPDD